MNAMTKALSLSGLGRRALSLGAVNAFDKAMQFLLPVVLVRSLDTVTFGEYRLLWLLLGTVQIASLNMNAGALYYFLPRSDALERRLYVNQTLIYMVLVGLACGWAVSSWNPLLPGPVHSLTQYGLLVPAFVALWMAAMMLDCLPTVDEKIQVQAGLTLGVAGLRVALVAAAAWFTGELRVLLWVLVGLGVLKLALLIGYIHRTHGLGRPWFSRQKFIGELRQVAPFGLSNALFALRAQADQWVAAAAFALSSFAAFSIAGIVGQVVNIFRVSVLEALLPQMSRLHAAGDVRGMAEMNSRGNVVVSAFLYPVLGFTFVFAEELVTVVYTGAYVDAAAAIRVYVVSMALRVIEIGSLLLLLDLGRFALQVNALALLVSVLVSWLGAHYFGLAGAAAGSVVSAYLDRALLLRRISLRSGIALRELQDWHGIGRCGLLAALASLLAWGAVHVFFSDASAHLRLGVGAALFGLAYAVTYGRRGHA